MDVDDKAFDEFMALLGGLDEDFFAAGPPPAGWGAPVTTLIHGPQDLQQPTLPATDPNSAREPAAPSGAPDRAIRWTPPRPSTQDAAAAATGTSGRAGKRTRGPALGSAREQVQSLEKQLARKMEELSLLQQQNDALKGRSRMLELVTRARDEQVQRLRLLREQVTMLHAKGKQQATSGGSHGTASDMNSTDAPHTSLTNPALAMSQQNDTRLAGTSQQVSGSTGSGSGHASNVHEPTSHLPAAAEDQLPELSKLLAVSMGDEEDKDTSVPEILTTLEPEAMLTYARLPIEQMMSMHHSVISHLTNELLKPDQGRLIEMMTNLREFSRAVALLSDKFQLMVSRDVRALPPLASCAEAAAAQAKLPAIPDSGTHTKDAAAPANVPGPLLPPLPSFSSSEGQDRAHRQGSAAGVLEAAPSADAVLMAAAVPTLVDTDPVRAGLGVSERIPHVGLNPPQAVDMDTHTSSGSNAQEGLLIASDDFKALEASQEMQDHWCRVAASLALTAQQRSDFIALWGLYQEWIGRLREERSGLSDKLNQVLNADKYGRVHQAAPTQTSVTEAQLLKRLHRSVQSEHAMLMLVGETIMYQVLNLEQAAKVLIQSWPYVPDPISALHAVVVSS